MPGAISGAGGHATTFAAACAMVCGFGLDDETALALLLTIHNPECRPPWTGKELRHKVESAAKHSRREPGHLRISRERDRETARTLTPIDDATYDRIASTLIELCTCVDEPDVVQYLDQRVLIVEAAHARVAGLPPRSGQGVLIAELLKTYSADTLARAGLLRRYDSGDIEQRWLWCPEHRLVIVWRALDGTAQTLQRRVLGSAEPRYVFPPGRRPLYPFGAEAVRATDTSWPIAYCEGAVDALALRLIAHRDRMRIVPLGLPGVDGWRSEWAQWTVGRVVRIALDADTAGERNVRTIAADCYRAGAAKVQRWRPPAGVKDWADSLIRRRA